MKPHDLKPFVIHRRSEALAPIATWDAAALEDLLAEPDVDKAPGPWTACVTSRLVVAASGPVAVGKTSQRLDAAGWFHAAAGADLDAARRSCWPALEVARQVGMGVGSLAPKLVLVGEKVEKQGQIPMHSRSGTWLWRALRAHGWDELACYVVNAYAPGKEARKPRPQELRALRDAFERYQPLWVALGQKASIVLGGAGIVHVLVDHPQHWARYKNEQGPAGYAGHLLAAGVPRGPYHGQLLPCVKLEEINENALLARRLGIATTVAHRPEPQERKRAGGKGVAEAHRFFVTGADDKGNKIETLRQACDSAGASYERCLRASREENWTAERDAQRERVLAKAKEKTSDLEAQKIATCRSLAWTGTALGLGSIVKRLQNPDGDLQKEIDPRQVLALAKVALGISQLGDPQTSDELKRVQQLGPTELLAEYKKVLGAFGVEEGEKS